MELEHAPADRLAAEKATNSQRVSLLSTLGTKLTALQNATQALKAETLFGKRLASSGTTGSSWGASAGTDTALGAYRIAVTNIATTAGLKGAVNVGSALNPASDDVSGLTLANLPLGQAITAGTFSVNGKQVTVALTDSLEDVFDAISTATGGDVTASYDHLADKITLASAGGTVMLGAGNDTSNFIRSMKLSNNGSSPVTSSAQLGSVKMGGPLASANLGTAITAVDAEGVGTFSINGVAIEYDVDGDTMTSVMKKINDSTAGVNASYDAINDRMVLTNKGTGDMGISVSEAAGGLLGALGLTSGTTFTRGENAEFTINGGDVLTSASNTLDATSHGVTGLSVTVNSEETQTINVSPDTTAMRAKVDAFIKDYNDVQQFLESQTKVTTDAKGKVSAAALSGNREIQEWARSLRTLAFDAVTGMAGSIKRLNDLGLDFKPGSSEIEVESESKLTAALQDTSGGIDEFFTTETTGFSARLDAFVEKISTQNEEQQGRINKTNTSLDDQIAAIERRLVQQRTLLESAFIQMELSSSKIKQQQTALDGMFAKQS
jgi:flagellar hook-associated protein 2